MTQLSEPQSPHQRKLPQSLALPIASVTLAGLALLGTIASLAIPAVPNPSSEGCQMMDPSWKWLAGLTGTLFFVAGVIVPIAIFLVLIRERRRWAVYPSSPGYQDLPSRLRTRRTLVIFAIILMIAASIFGIADLVHGAQYSLCGHIE